jgi:hypothetical protein
MHWVSSNAHFYNTQLARQVLHLCSCSAKTHSRVLTFAYAVKASFILVSE